VVHAVTDRIAVGLRFVAYALALLGVAVVIVGLWFTTTAEGLITAGSVGGIAFGIPAIAAFVLAQWIDARAEALAQVPPLVIPGELREGSRAPFAESVPRYLIAVASAFVAWGLRYLLDNLLPNNVPFITFFAAVAVAGWLGGFGPAVLAMLLTACIARYFYMPPLHTFQVGELSTAVALAIFVLVCLVIAVLTSMLHGALRRIQVLSRELASLQAAQRDGLSASGTTLGEPRA
jgi:Domain of unknown function (DUF4118)